MKFLSNEEKKKELGIDQLSEEEAKDLLLFAIQELESRITCDQCGEEWVCDGYLDDPLFYIHCQKLLIKRLKLKL